MKDRVPLCYDSHGMSFADLLKELRTKSRLGHRTSMFWTEHPGVHLHADVYLVMTPEKANSAPSNVAVVIFATRFRTADFVARSRSAQKSNPMVYWRGNLAELLQNLRVPGSDESTPAGDQAVNAMQYFVRTHFQDSTSVSFPKLLNDSEFAAFAGPIMKENSRRIILNQRI